ncbi:3-deoxy-D-manno-octulosonic acid transferase [Tropicimonas sediminicola]|uniref:3-deoxy-D-manno-octulosonic acid transferase n=1 Tax=Tropicimonas sediminicola TaxID=1031541 RepID=A0A239KHU9_9RHOB|nr:glycosyltransferase N-terminal domain-containing protein [Tropicimonas sediminicola]SNT17655.1 3-deoxy-D-manno-octulosonic-acid transferase [Tropicimonas sediminicola]
MFTYRLALTLAAPLAAGYFALRLARGRETLADLGERLGRGASGGAASGPVIWLHGASNGELTSARDLIETLLREAPECRMVVTSNSLTGRDMVRGWGLARLEARLAPLDYRPCLAAFLDNDRPSLLILLEGDLWPNRMAMAAKRGIPVAMISARISERSAAKWHRRPGMVRHLFEPVRLFSAQDAASESKFRELGLPPERIVAPVTLKASVRLPAPDPDLLTQYREVFPREDTWLAASTHEGEEEQVLVAFELARRARPSLRMILAPRHPARSAEVRALLEGAGLRFRTRSAGDAPDKESDVYLADTLGEMPLWYALSGQCFVGGSLVAKGGHTPYEPAQFGSAILHGPDLRNFAEPYAALDAAGGALKVADGPALGEALARLDPPALDALAERATDALAGGAGEGMDSLVEKTLRLAGVDRRN